MNPNVYLFPEPRCKCNKASGSPKNENNLSRGFLCRKVLNKTAFVPVDVLVRTCIYSDLQYISITITRIACWLGQLLCLSGSQIQHSALSPACCVIAPRSPCLSMKLIFCPGGMHEYEYVQCIKQTVDTANVKKITLQKSSHMHYYQTVCETHNKSWHYDCVCTDYHYKTQRRTHSPSHAWRVRPGPCRTARRDRSPFAGPGSPVHSPPLCNSVQMQYAKKGKIGKVN